MAHFRFVGRLVEIYSAQSFPVYPVAPKTIRSYAFGVRSVIVGFKCMDKLIDGEIQQEELSIDWEQLVR